MKRIIAGLSCLVFVLFVGCGGDSSKAATPPKLNLGGKNTADDQKTQEAIANWAQNTIQACSSGACSFARAATPTLVAAIASPQPVTQDQLTQSVSPYLNDPTQQGCVYALKQLKLNMDTAAGGTYSRRPDVMSWFEDAIVRPIGTAGSQCLPQQILALPGGIQGAAQLGGIYANNLSNQVGAPQWASSALTSGINQSAGIPGF